MIHICRLIYGIRESSLRNKEGNRLIMRAVNLICVMHMLYDGIKEHCNVGEYQ